VTPDTAWLEERVQRCGERGQVPYSVFTLPVPRTAESEGLLRLSSCVSQPDGAIRLVLSRHGAVHELQQSKITSPLKFNSIDQKGNF
jgi:hypothetical protein